MIEKYCVTKCPEKGKKFHLPRKLKNIPNTQELIDWYENKLDCMVLRQFRLGNYIGRLCRVVKGLEKT